MLKMGRARDIVGTGRGKKRIDKFSFRAYSQDILNAKQMLPRTKMSVWIVISVKRLKSDAWDRAIAWRKTVMPFASSQRHKFYEHPICFS